MGKVLLAEDDPVMRQMVEILLKRRQIAFRSVENGREALEAWRRESFSLILMDIQMPVMDGYEATAEIRRQERESGEHVPIVAMTAHVLADENARCLSAGMDGYLSKPIEFPRFYTLLEKYAGGR